MHPTATVQPAGPSSFCGHSLRFPRGVRPIAASLKHCQYKDEHTCGLL
jgi:hypothetical protein